MRGRSDPKRQWSPQRGETVHLRGVGRDPTPSRSRPARSPGRSTSDDGADVLRRSRRTVCISAPVPRGIPRSNRIGDVEQRDDDSLIGELRRVRTGGLDSVHHTQTAVDDLRRTRCVHLHRSPARGVRSHPRAQEAAHLRWRALRRLHNLFRSDRSACSRLVRRAHGGIAEPPIGRRIRWHIS